MDKIIKEFGVIAGGIIGLAIIAVLVSRNAQTGNVLKSGGQAFAGLINAAVSPITGGGSFGANGFSNTVF